ncbi:MAG: Mur ligase domain-containing protein, partial [Alphaproteobacteria bacterium]
MSGYLWTAGDAAAATAGDARGGWRGVTGISIDTRAIAPGELFVALAGENRDGHDFVARALEAGAGAAMVSRVPDGVAGDAPLLVVGDTLAALGALGAAARARSAARVIAVTGSVGKTSTKEMLRTMLGCQGRVHAAEKSF